MQRKRFPAALVVGSWGEASRHIDCCDRMRELFRNVENHSARNGSQAGSCSARPPIETADPPDSNHATLLIGAVGLIWAIAIRNVRPERFKLPGACDVDYECCCLIAPAGLLIVVNYLRRGCAQIEPAGHLLDLECLLFQAGRERVHPFLLLRYHFFLSGNGRS